jgi:hypothetical protein
MFIPYCDESIDFIYMTLSYNVHCRVASEDVISINLFTVTPHVTEPLITSLRS